MKESVCSTPLLSVVVPAYNASKTILRTLASLMDQSVEREMYRIIVVDDGSVDDTLQLCLEYAEQHENLLVLHQENGGVSSARNLGINHAVGRWITFVDSDDVVVPEYVETVVTTAPEVQCVVFDHYVGKECVFTPEKRWMRALSDQIYDASGVLEWICDQKLNSPWDKRYELSVIQEHDIRFNPYISMGEDFLFNFHYVTQIQSVYVSAKAIYVYIDNADGLCRKAVTENRLSEFETIYSRMQKELMSEKYLAHYEKILNLSFLRNIFRYAGQLKVAGYSNREIRELFDGSGMVHCVMDEQTVNLKYILRKFLLKSRLYGFCALTLLRR